MKSVLALVAGLAILGATVPGSLAGAAETRTIQIVSALYGPPDLLRPHDFTERLQAICGPDAVACQSFCSRAGTGARPRFIKPILGHRPMCRVVYRCGRSITKATDADEDDTIILSCPGAP